MPRVRIDLFVSLDGYASTIDQTPANPMGEDWGRLTAAYAATRTFQERVFGDTSGAGTTGIDDSYAAGHFESIGAEIMGATMSASTRSPMTRTGRAGGVTSLRSAPRSTSSATRRRDRRSPWRVARRSTFAAGRSRTFLPRRPRRPVA